MSTERIRAGQGSAIDHSVYTERPMSRSLPGAGGAADIDRGSIAAASTFSTASLSRRQPASVARPVADDGKAVLFADEEDELKAVRDRRIPKGLPKAAPSTASQGISSISGKKEYCWDRIYIPSSSMEDAPPITAPAMPSKHATLAAAAVLGVVLLVVPALLPPLTAPPKELLLLPILVMVLLVAVANARDSTPRIDPKFKL